MKKHFLDKPILRDLFWFIVLPHRLKMFIASQKPLPQEFQKVIDDNYWELLEK
jgi:hypothetical protein